MALPSGVTGVLEARELWAAVAASLLALGTQRVLVHRGAVRPGAGMPVVLVAGLTGGTAAGSHTWWVVLVALATVLAAAGLGRSGVPGAGGVLVSMMAAGALYACLPDTEVALALLGATSTTGVATLLLRLPWQVAAWTTSAVLLAATAADGRSRATAVIGGGAIAVTHALATLPGGKPGWPRVLVVPVAGTAMVVCSRVAGRGTATVRSGLIAAGCVLVVAAVALVTSSSAGRPPQRLDPPAGDD